MYSAEVVGMIMLSQSGPARDVQEVGLWGK